MKIKVGYSASANDTVEDILEVEASELLKLTTAEEKQAFLDQKMREFVFDRIDAWAVWVEE